MKVLYILDPAIIGGATKAFLIFISKLKDKGVCAEISNKIFIFLLVPIFFQNIQ